jgi:hypothetical protein
LGFLDIYETGTGYRVVPLVAFDRSRLFRPDARARARLSSVFHVPLGFADGSGQSCASSSRIRLERASGTSMPSSSSEHYIWGATAGILRNLHDQGLSPPCFVSS